MLTIHTPIELTTNPSMLHLNNSFAQRLVGNYQVIGNGLEAEDMLHFLSQPPEIYLAQGGMTSLIEQQSIVENQNLKLDVINNVMNRILTADTYQMTYQDQVFIESVLKKIGVTDVQMFMRQVENVRQEIKNIDQLTDLYWNQKELVSTLREYRKLQAEEEKPQQVQEGEKSQDEVLFLHQEIMNRLKTGAIYQELRNYISSSANYHQTISREEMQIGEQTITAQNILLNKLKNYTMVEEQPLVFHSLNAYELGDDIRVWGDQSRIINQVVQAVLLNATHQMYALRTDELNQQKNVWYQLAGALYQATENTIQRFADYQEQHIMTPKDADVYSKTVQQYQKSEIRALEQYLLTASADTGRVVVTPQTVTGTETALIYAPADVSEEDELRQDESGSTIQNFQTTQIHGQQLHSLTRQENLLKQQLEQINQNNIRNGQLLQQLILSGESDGQGVRINREKARKDALRAISSPEEVLQTYLESETLQLQRERTERENLTRVFGEETVKIFETLEKYQKTPRLMIESGVVVPDAPNMLLRDILVQEEMDKPEALLMPESDETGRFNRAQEIPVTYKESATTQIERERVEKEELVRAFGENTVKIIETLERYRETPLQPENIMMPSINTQDGLVYDMPGQETADVPFAPEQRGEDTSPMVLQPDEIPVSLRERETTQVRRERTEKERLTRYFGEDTRTILEILEKYHRIPHQVTEAGETVLDAPQMLHADDEQKEVWREQSSMPQTGSDRSASMASPEEVLLTYLQNETTQVVRERIEKEEFARFFGEDTQTILAILEKYQKTPRQLTESGVVVTDAPELIHYDTQVQTRQLLREYLPEHVTQLRQETQRRMDRVELVHKKQEESMEEEVLEQLRQMQRTTHIDNVQTKEQVIERNTTQEIINSRVNELQVRQNEELARLISEKVQRQLGSLSEQVYGKLEKRMDTERRRRGL